MRARWAPALQRTAEGALRSVRGTRAQFASLSSSNRRHAFSSSRRISPELWLVAPPSKPRGRREGRVLTSHPRSAARSVAQRDRTAAYRWRQSLGLPCAMVGRLMPRSPGSRTFLLASLAPRIDDAVRPVGLARISAKGLTVATTARTTRFCRTHQRRSSARGQRAHRDYPPCP
jgi:hypothetical protein